MIEIKNVSVAPRLLPLSLCVNEGEILHVIGPNGSGKSTLLEAISGLLKCHGEICLSGESIAHLTLAELAQKRAYLPQTGRPAFSMSVFHYLSLSIPTTANQFDISPAVKEITELLSIENKLHRSIHHLSGGEWQRVRLAGICLQVWPSLNPYGQALLLDEPSAPLDVGQESLLYRLIDLMASKGLAIIMANHDLNRTLRHSDNVLLLREGVVQAVGKTDEVMNESMLSEVFNTQVKKVFHNDSPYLLFE
ncbi:vitamin B12 ABC transporter ATP-binding protein BtuD [Vibrio rumoiensis]|uniref:Vitamin B12 import ATP-binding protein BtuD n=1 Tax=Vibrio rumoiensis 1S-45 TaxID=1188252 RepID=A0A1E5DZ06_9VIBR|nr:vitamin B12 ABC transporter ATP-binding protein BtuD [Vibrio rumoiensis]OEF23133.1 vitamin B12 ABC transporter ATP-binding protein BtuD [Vibrio rumoiensis 1S-45]